MVTSNTNNNTTDNDLQLSLSLSLHHHHHHRHHNHPAATAFNSSSPWTKIPDDTFPPSSTLINYIDVNRPVGPDDYDAGVSSPNSTLSTLSGKPSSGAGGGEDNEVERASSRGVISDDEDGGDGSRKKLRLSKDQSAVLEESFKEHHTLNPKQKLALANRLGLRPRQVEVWFQNRRARTKLKQTEVDCEFLKKCCEQLTEENRRLQKEVAELRALKMSPQFYMQMTPPTTLTMCPSCERVASGPVQTRPGSNRISAPVPVRPFQAPKARS